MKRLFTKIVFTALLTTLLFAGFSGNAQTKTDSVAKTTATPMAAPTMAAPKPADTAWHPQRRVWGYAFGDFYYNAHGDADIISATGLPAATPSNRGPETNYAGTPGNRNAFQFRRIYLG